MKLFTPLSRLIIASIVLLMLNKATVSAQHMKLNVLFLGNSFTSTNNLPVVVSSIAASMGDTLTFDSNTPGGYTLKQHSLDPASTGKIAVGTWNYVVLQAQSQEPSFPDAQVATDLYPYATSLDSLVHNKNACGRTVFYMTWGYPDGDASNCPIYPPVCTYQGMDSLLNLRYNNMASSNNALVSPVGEVFKEIMRSLPGINLFQTDRVHPSEAGSYAAALTFYTILYRKDPSAVTFDFTLPPPQATLVKNVVKTIVFNRLPKFHVAEYDPNAGFSVTTVGKKATFNAAISANAVHYNWDFGDGSPMGTTVNPVHNYTTDGTYNVKLYADNCILVDSTTQPVVIINSTAIRELATIKGIQLYPNPAGAVLNIKAENGMALQNMSVNITNLLGMKVLVIPHMAASSIDISGLAKGIYVINIQDASGFTITRKFVKE